MTKSKLWTKNFVVGTLINFLITINFFILLVIMSVYAMDRFHSTPSEAGLASSIFIIGAVFSRLLAGRLMGRFGQRKMLSTGIILVLLMTLTYFVISSILSLFMIRFIHGAAFGLASSAIGTIVASIIPEDRRGEGIGYYMLSATLATAIGPFIAIYINKYGSFQLIFIICLVAAILSLACLLLLKVPEVRLTAEQMKEAAGFKISSFIEIKALPISIVIAVLYFAYSSILSFFSAYVISIDLVDAASFFFVVTATSIFISRPVTGKLFDTKGENFILYPSFIIFAIGLIILSQSYYGSVLLLSAVFIGLGAGTIQSSCQAIAIKVAPPHRLGFANSTYFTFMDIGVGFGPFLLGFLIPVIGYRGLYFSMAFVSLACLFLYHFLHGRKATRHQKVVEA